MRKIMAPRGHGLTKIQTFCRLVARLHGLQWAWVDTCCIDKRSSAELSEAINSMYKWYERSEVCYVYLSDVKRSSEEVPNESSDDEDRNFEARSPEFKQSYRDSNWFTRGWTLQELLAPRHVIFFDGYWNEIGDRGELADEITSITGIEGRYLRPYGRSRPILSASIAKRMSYASRRVTSREEDKAYCLLGLFDVNMPLLYGEGAEKSFRRLQLEIMRSTDDESLFAWTSDQPASGMLADNPSCFANSHYVNARRARPARRPLISMTSRGLEFPIPHDLPDEGLIPVNLNCCWQNNTRSLCIQLRLQDRTAVRTRCDVLRSEQHRPQSAMHIRTRILAKKLKNTRNIYVRQPQATDIEYNRLLAEIEEGRINFTDLPLVKECLENGKSYNILLNPGPQLPATSWGKCLVNPGETSLEKEAKAKGLTQRILRKTANNHLLAE
ncbi:MAG: hypothetical protein Q9170_007320 [Blastenia crenularia]